MEVATAKPAKNGTTEQKQPPKEIYRCDVCALNFSSSSIAEAHRMGAKHTKKLEAQKILQQLQTTEMKHIDSTPGKKSLFTCRVCKVVVNSSQQLQAHLAGTKHAQAVEGKPPAPGVPYQFGGKPGEAKKRKSNDNYETPAKKGDFGTGPNFCDVCQIGVNSNTQLQQHLVSQKHKNKVLELTTGIKPNTDSKWSKTSSAYNKPYARKPILDQSKEQSYYGSSSYYGNSYDSSRYNSTYEYGGTSTEPMDSTYRTDYSTASYSQTTPYSSTFSTTNQFRGRGFPGMVGQMTPCQCKCMMSPTRGVNSVSPSRGGYGRGITSTRSRASYKSNFISGGVINSY